MPCSVFLNWIMWYWACCDNFSLVKLWSRIHLQSTILVCKFELDYLSVYFLDLRASLYPLGLLLPLLNKLEFKSSSDQDYTSYFMNHMLFHHRIQFQISIILVTSWVICYFFREFSFRTLQCSLKSQPSWILLNLCWILQIDERYCILLALIRDGYSNPTRG